MNEETKKFITGMVDENVLHRIRLAKQMVKLDDLDLPNEEREMFNGLFANATQALGDLNRYCVVLVETKK